MIPVRSKTIISVGSLLILLLLVLVLGLWISDVYKSKETLTRIVSQERAREHLSKMREYAHRRAISLHRMTSIEDLFERDEEFMQFRQLGSNFLAEREFLMQTPLTPQEQAIWDKIGDNIRRGGPAQRQVADLLLDDKIDSARQLLLETVDSTMGSFRQDMLKISDIKRSMIDNELAQASQGYNNTYIIMALLGSVIVLLIGFTQYIVRRTGKTEEALMDHGMHIRSMYEVSAMTGASSEEQLIEMLKLGCRFLGMDIGKVCEIDEANQSTKVINIYSKLETEVSKGTVIPLHNTFCQYVVPSDEPLALNNIAQSQYKDSDAYTFSAVQAYIAAPIKLKGCKFGTVSFFSQTPRMEGFSETDIDMVKLIGSWINSALEREFAQIELRKAKEEAELANDAKSKFLANMSHELRTPLNAIIGYSQLISDDVIDNQQQNYLDDLDKITTSGNHLLSLINNVLDLSKIEAGKVEVYPETFKVTALVHEVVATLRPLCERNNNQLNVVIDNNMELMCSDLTKIKQVLYNVLSNAIKFTENGQIMLTVQQRLDTNKDWVVFEVHDTGIGMSEEQIQTVFEKFTQADTHITTKYGGTGLGMAICKKICELLHGDISVKSRKGQGSIVTIALPHLEQSAKSNDSDSMDLQYA
jgi:signal transduction histidine kinase